VPRSTATSPALAADHLSRPAGSRVTALPELPVVADVGEVDLMASGDSEALAGLEPEAINDPTGTPSMCPKIGIYSTPRS